MKKLILLLPLLAAGCASTITNLTPKQQVRAPNNLYPVEVAFNSQQQSLRWDTVKTQLIVGDQTYPMQRTALMQNRWEGMLPAQPESGVIHYHFKFDFEENAFGKPKPDSAISHDYILKIVEQQ